MRKYNFSRMSIMLVDDNRFIRNTIAALCRSYGFNQVYEADDGSEALRLLKEWPIDIVVCDWMMEPLDGFDLTRLLRTAADSPNPFVPIIMLSGHTQYSKVIGARDVGVTEFLAKPISAATLLARLIYVCERSRPFVRCPGFFGPDRRRKLNGVYKGPDRRKGEAPAMDVGMQEMSQDGVDAGWGLSQDEINAILAEESAAGNG